jgi:hypothetical protein
MTRLTEDWTSSRAPPYLNERWGFQPRGAETAVYSPPPVGFALLFVLSALAGFAALAVAVRARPRGRAELLVAASMLWNALIVVPIYALGLTHRLWPRSVAVGSLLTSVATLLLATAGVGPRALLSDTTRAAGGLLRMPVEALALSWRSRRFIFLGVLFTAGLLVYLAASAWLGQPLPHWDPLWYHDTMVGFSLQNHGFAFVDLPDTLQKVNGYVRLGEMTQLWMVVFADRRLADLTNLLFAPAIAAGTYALARRYTDRVSAMGWGVCVVLMPGCASYLHSTYVDPQNAALVLGAVLFSTVDRPRLADGWLAGLGLALALASKGIALVSVPIIGVVGATRFLRAHWHVRRGAALGVVLGGLALVLAAASATYLRNYFKYHNPFWPDMRVEVPALGIHWPGMGPLLGGSDAGKASGLPVNLNESFPKLMDHLFALPWSVKGMYFDQAVEYGVGIVWVALPLGAIAFLLVFHAALRRRLGHLEAEIGPAPPLGLAIILGVMIAGSPALWSPRYHPSHVGLLFVLVAWLTRRAAWERLGDAALAVVVVTSLMMFWWQPEPRWYFTPDRLAALARAPAINREVDRELGAPTTLVAGLAREKELGPGKLLVFDEQYCGFPSLFWNNTYSNRVQFMRGGPSFLSRAAEAGATWVFLSASSPTLSAARAPGSGWQEVGELNPINAGFAFRRVPGATRAPLPSLPPTPPTPVAAPATRPGWPPAGRPPFAPPTAKLPGPVAAPTAKLPAPIAAPTAKPPAPAVKPAATKPAGKSRDKKRKPPRDP